MTMTNVKKNLVSIGVLTYDVYNDKNQWQLDLFHFVQLVEKSNITPLNQFWKDNPPTQIQTVSLAIDYVDKLQSFSNDMKHNSFFGCACNTPCFRIALFLNRMLNQGQIKATSWTRHHSTKQ